MYNTNVSPGVALFQHCCIAALLYFLSHRVGRAVGTTPRSRFVGYWVMISAIGTQFVSGLIALACGCGGTSVAIGFLGWLTGMITGNISGQIAWYYWREFQNPE